MNVGRDRREGFNDVIGRETISAQNTGFFGVVSGDADAEGGGGDEAGGAGGVAIGVVAEGFFACFVRTCLCSLVLLSNFSGHRLQANVFVFSFAIRASSAVRFFAMLAFLY